MKKLLIALGVIVTFLAATAFISSEKTSTVPGPGGMCKIVGNCTVELNGGSNGSYHVYASNNNSYKVTVEYTVIGYKDGKERQVNAGTLSLNPKGEDYCQRRSSSFTTSCEDVSLGTVRVLKCE
ncbi:MAG: hypothetical protein IJQ14_07220 [Bacteroidales bacterium]|nr:hypothetical protein [Bacteroidales bacterium]